MLSTPEAGIEPAHSGDVAAFGLLLMVTNFNGLEGADNVDSGWKTTTTGLCVLLVVLFAVIFGATVFTDTNDNIFDKRNIFIASVALSLASAIFSYTIWRRLSCLPGGGQNV